MTLGGRAIHARPFHDEIEFELDESNVSLSEPIHANQNSLNHLKIDSYRDIKCELNYSL